MTVLAKYLQSIRNSSFRHVIWPVRSHELMKFIPMALLLFVVLLNQNIIRVLKDSLVVTQIGPEVISFIKLWVESPLGFLFVIIYTKLCNVVSTERVFRYVVVFFMVFFAIFAFILFPNGDLFLLAPSTTSGLIDTYPHLKWFILICSNWTLVLFYVMGELWPVIVGTFLFWHLANKITEVSEASRFYSLFKFFGQFNLIISANIAIYFSQSINIVRGFSQADSTTATLQTLTLIVLASGALAIAIHYFIEKKIMGNPKFYKIKELSKPLKLSLLESWKMVIASKYLWNIFIITLAYSISVNLIEGLWFAKARDLYPDTNDFLNYHSKVLLYTGIAATSFAFLGSFIINRLGWFFAAAMTPITIGAVGTIFFISVFYLNDLEYLVNNYFNITISALSIIVLIGAMQNILGKGVKYSLFDATKEMLYIPLKDNELKTKGKVAVDIVGAKMGKSAGALVQFVTFTIFPKTAYDDLSGFLLILFALVCILWFINVKSVNTKYQKLI